MALATRIAVMDRGKVVQVGTPRRSTSSRQPLRRRLRRHDQPVRGHRDRVRARPHHACTAPRPAATCWSTMTGASRPGSGSGWRCARRRSASASSPRAAARVNQLRGTVWELGYLGNRSTYRIKTTSGKVITAFSQNERRTSRDGDRLERRGVRELGRGCRRAAAFIDRIRQGRGSIWPGLDAHGARWARCGCWGCLRCRCRRCAPRMARRRAARPPSRERTRAPQPPPRTGRARTGAAGSVVTATRREESLSKVPISVTAMTQEDMDEKGIKDFLDIAKFTPGVSIDNSADQCDLDPRHILLGRRWHDRYLHRRHADSDALRGVQPRRHAAQDFRPAAGRDPARPAGHAVRRRLRGRRGALHPDAAEHHQRQHLRAQRALLHGVWRAELRVRHRTRSTDRGRHLRHPRQRLVSRGRRLDQPRGPDQR